MNSKFNVGDKVRIKPLSWFIKNSTSYYLYPDYQIFKLNKNIFDSKFEKEIKQIYIITKDMLTYAGKKVTITNLKYLANGITCFKLDIDKERNNWLPDILEKEFPLKLMLEKFYSGL